MDVSDSDDYDSDELNEAYEEAWGGLKDGTVTCLNSDGTFRCPYSPSRKKQTYRYNEIYQHAEAVGKGNRGPVAAGRHIALSEYLVKDFSERAQPQAQRESHFQQDVAPRVDSEDVDKRVYPWMGILQNIDIQTRSPSESFRIGAWAVSIKEKLKDFNPESVKVLHDGEGHQAVAVIRFQNSMDGFKDAEAFENSFRCLGRGRSDFERDYRNGCGTHLYGWVATNMDVEGSNKLVSDHLKANGDLKSFPEIVRELEARAQQQVQHLKEVLMKKDEALQVAHREKWNLKNKVDSLTAQLERAQQEKKNFIDDHEKKPEDLLLAASPVACNECGSSDPSMNKSEGEELEVPLVNLSF